MSRPKLFSYQGRPCISKCTVGLWAISYIVSEFCSRLGLYIYISVQNIPSCLDLLSSTAESCSHLLAPSQL